MLSSKAVSTALLAVLFGGLAAGGLRDPWAWTALSGLLWTTALLSAPPAAVPLSRWLAWLGWALLCALASAQPLSAPPVLARWAIAAVFLSLAWGWGEEERRRWLQGLCGAGLLAAGAALLSVWGLSAYGMTRRSVGELMVGLYGSYYNYTAFVLAAACAAAFAALLHPKRPSGAMRWALGLLFAPSAVFFLRTSPRSAALGTAFAAGAALWRRGLWKVLLLGVLAAGAAAAMLSGPALSALLKRDRSEVAKRPQLWAAALRIAADHPVVGEGPGNFESGFARHNFPSRYRLMNYQFTTAHAHSEPLQAAAETGVVGLALLLMAFWASWRPEAAARASAAQEAALAAFLAMSVMLLLDNMLHVPAFLLLYLSALACLRREGPPGLPVPAGAWRGLCAAGLALALTAPWPLVRGEAFARASVLADPALRLKGAAAGVRLFPAEAGRRQALAQAWLSQDPPRFEEAEAQFREAWRLSPRNALYAVMLAEMVRRSGRWDEVLALARSALVLEPNFLQARLLEAEVLARRGEKARSRQRLEEVLRVRRSLQEAGLYSGDHTRYTGYDETVGSFDEGRFKLVSALSAGR